MGFPPNENGRYVAMTMFSGMGELFALIFAVASESLGPNYRGEVKIPFSTPEADPDLVFFFLLPQASEQPYSDAELKRTLEAHRLDQLRKDNWVVEVGQSGPVEEKAVDIVRSWRIAKDHPEWVDVKSTDEL